MPPDKKRPAHKGTGAVENSYVTIGTYSTSLPSATDFTPIIVASRYRLSLPVARVVCELASIGGGAA